MALTDHEKMIALQCVRLRREGYNYEEIADETGWSPKRACDTVQAYLAASKETFKEDILAVYQIEWSRFEGMLKGILPDAFRGDTEAIKVATKLLATRAKIFGLELVDPNQMRSLTTSEASYDLSQLTDDELAMLNRLEQKMLTDASKPETVDGVLTEEDTQ